MAPKLVFGREHPKKCPGASPSTSLTVSPGSPPRAGEALLPCLEPQELFRYQNRLSGKHMRVCVCVCVWVCVCVSKRGTSKWALGVLLISLLTSPKRVPSKQRAQTHIPKTTCFARKSLVKVLFFEAHTYCSICSCMCHHHTTHRFFLGGRFP